MLTRDQILAVYAAGPEAVVSLVETLLATQAQQAQQIAALSGRIQDLEERLAKLNKDRHNSSKPPSSDPPANTVLRKPRSLRQKSGKHSGGQAGHAGTTLLLADDPDHILVHAPGLCAGCGQSLEQVPAQSMQRRQVHDLPPLKLSVTEHQVLTKRCPACQCLNSSAFPPQLAQPVQYGPGVRALCVYLQEWHLLPFERTQQLLADLFGGSLCEGTLANFIALAHERLAPVEAVIKAALTKAGVAHFDETGARIGTRLYWLHVCGTPSLTYYVPHKKRGKAALEDIDILPAFAGTAVHDAWSSYLSFGCDHALCNAHLLRELTCVHEQMGQSWAGQAIKLLCDIKEAVQEAQATGAGTLSQKRRLFFLARYQWVIKQGRAANAQAPLMPSMPLSTPGPRGRPKQSPAQNLLDRMEQYRPFVLAFMDDFAVPFDNNLAERDLRMMKVHQKVSGCFRSWSGAAQFCRIRGYLSTLRKQGADVLAGLRSVFNGTPFVPTLQA
jgi:transposase